VSGAIALPQAVPPTAGRIIYPCRMCSPEATLPHSWAYYVHLREEHAITEMEAARIVSEGVSKGVESINIKRDRRREALRVEVAQCVKAMKSIGVLPLSARVIYQEKDGGKRRKAKNLLFEKLNKPLDKPFSREVFELSLNKLSEEK
jgi:hypothetical protein